MIASRVTLFLPKPLLRPRALPPCHLFSIRLSPGPVSEFRSFHTTPTPQFLDACFGQVQNLITGLHSLSGLPWVATLPLTALIVRSVIVGPLSLISHKATLRRLALVPLTHAWRAVIRKKVMMKAADQGPVVCDRIVERAMRSKIRELYSRQDCGNLRVLLPLLQVPVFLVVIESIRKMCGTHQGLLGLVTRQDSNPVEESGDDTMEEVSQAAASIEQSLSQEGALWFPDLLAPDPLLVLPFLLSGSLFASISYQDRAKAGQTPSKWSQRLTSTMKIIALAIGPATIQLPSALLLYWISSSLFAIGQHVLLDWYYPRQVPITPCKPQAKRGWLDPAAKG